MHSLSLHSLSLKLGLALVAGLGLAAAQPTSAQTVGNGGFETPALGSGAYAYSAADAAYPVPVFTAAQAAQTEWDFEGGSGISANGSAFTGSNPAAPEGTQVAFLQQTGSFSQTVTGFTDGLYSFSFDAAQRAGYGVQDFQVSLDGTALGVFVPGSTDYAALTTAYVPVTAGDHTLTFTGLDTATGDNTAFIDDVAVSAPVPEASTTVSLGLLLALGMGGVMVAARRKKADVKTVA